MWGRPLAIMATVGGFQVDGLTSLSVQLVVRAGGERERERRSSQATGAGGVVLSDRGYCRRLPGSPDGLTSLSGQLVANSGWGKYSLCLEMKE